MINALIHQQVNERRTSALVTPWPHVISSLKDLLGIPGDDAVGLLKDCCSADSVIQHLKDL